MRTIRPAITATTLVLVGLLFVGAGPATEPATPDSITSEMHVQEFPACTYLYASQETTIAQMGPVIAEIMTRLGEAIQEGQVRVVGAPIFVYKGATGDMNKPFQLDIGFPVAEGTQGNDDLKVRTLDKYRCATVIYSGPVAQIGQAYQKVFTDLMEAGLKPSGDSREMHFYWESAESPNNVVLIQIGVQ